MTTTNAIDATNVDHGIVVGNGFAYSSIDPSSTSHRPLCSQGLSADPAYDAEPVVDKITINDAPVDPTDGTNKAYVDAIASGFEFKDSCYVATTTNLNATYDNGTAGVGATLTNAGTLAAFSSDDISPSANARVLVRQQTSQLENGIYELTTVGSGAVAWVLTRTTDYDTPSEVAQGTLTAVEFGTLYADSLWIQTDVVTTIGTDDIKFVRFDSSAESSFPTDSGTAIPSAGQLDILGTAAQGVATSGSGNTVTITAIDATTSQKGVVELTTDAEAVAGTDTTRAVTAEALKAKLGNQTAKSVPYGAGNTAAIAWTSALTDGQLVIGSTAGTPAAANLTSSGGTVNITNGSNTINLEVGGAHSSSFPTDSGTAIPSAGALNVFGTAAQGIHTSATGNTITITADNATTTQKGVLELASDAETIAGTVTTKANTPETLKAKLGTQTNHSLPYGTGNSTALGWTSALTNGQIVIGSTSGAPAAANITSTGGTVTVTNGANTINLEVGGAHSSSFATDSGTAIPSAGVLNILGTSTQGITTSGSGNTVTLTVANASTTQKGVVALATSAQTIAGTDTTHANTPESLKFKLGNQTSNSIPYGAGTSSAIAWTSALTSGQVVIGGTSTPAAATLTAGTGIAIANGNNSITIAASGGGFNWVTVSGTTQAISVNHGYFSNNAGTVTFTLPATATEGDTVRIVGLQGLWRINQNANQQVKMGIASSTVGAGGFVLSTHALDAVELVASNTGASTVWVIVSSIGNITFS